jgi:DNA-binding LytR/AlgR family response regulator
VRSLKAAICDDEPLAVERLERMLNGLPGVEVVGTFLSGEMLLSDFPEGADLIFLDVEMPKLDGFDVVEALSRREWSEGDNPSDGAPLVICVTAHSEFAVTAFDCGAVDFLTKPVRLSRLETAVERARAAIENRQARRRLGELVEQLAAFKDRQSSTDQEPSLWVRKGSQRVRLDLAKVDWISAEGECVRFHSGGESFLERSSISSVADRFGPFGFVRIHRSAIVNSARIESLGRTRWGSLQLRLADGSELRVSRSYQDALRKLAKG